LRHFPESFEFIDAIVTSNAGNVLVHCLGGISRSVTITIGYVMIKLNKNSKEAFDYVKNLHRKAYPNRGFLDQLKLFENVVVNYYEELEKADLAKVNNY
jgi:protein-tyrosine phosphatase